jgi:hypothetical protein
MKKAIICLLWSGLIFFVYQEALAELFKWVDEKGIIHISDCLPKYLKDNPNIITISDRRTNFRPEAPAFTNQDPQDKTTLDIKSSKVTRGNKDSKVEFYARGECPCCGEALYFFRGGRIPLRDYAGDLDQTAPLRKR